MAYNPDEPRDQQGKWTTGGGGGKETRSIMRMGRAGLVRSDKRGNPSFSFDGGKSWKSTAREAIYVADRKRSELARQATMERLKAASKPAEDWADKDIAKQTAGWEKRFAAAAREHQKAATKSYRKS